jgi:hypothetical protein
VEIRYFEILDVEKGRASFVFPMTVGSRYHPDGAVPDADRVPSKEGEYRKAGERSGVDLDLRVDLDAGAALRDLRSPSHDIDVTSRGARASVSLHPADRIPNKDLVLSWRVAGDRPEASVLAHRSDVGGFFTLILQPELEPDPDVVVPREVVLVVDCSGSMRGMPIETAKAVVRRTLKTLSPSDTFRILRFSVRASGLAPDALPATPENVAKGLAYIDAMRGMGGTSMIEGIRASLAGPRDPERLRVVHFLTDGYIGNELEILAEVEKRLEGARMFPLGVGSSVNRYLIDRLARVGRGAPAYVRQGASEKRVEEEVARFVERVRRATVVDLEVDWGGLPVKDVVPARLPDLFVGQPVVVHGVYDGAGEGEIVLRGRRGGRPWQRTVRVSLPDREERHGALAQAWARARIAELMLERPPGYGKRGAELALEFRLMSEWTAFVAVEERVVVEGGAKKVVRQPLEMPEGTDRSGFFGKGDFFSDAPFDGPSTKRAIGVGGGAGGRRSLRAEGGGGTQGAVDLGLEWLKAKQRPDGSWDGDIRATGLSLLAYLGAGETHKVGRYRWQVRLALRNLKQNQRPDGAFAEDGAANAIATLAMSECFALTGSPLFKQAAQMAIDALVAQPPSADPRATVWIVAALRSAKSCDLRVPEDAIGKAVAALGRDAPADLEAAAAGALARSLAGQKPESHPDLGAILDRLAEEAPKAGAPSTLFATMALSRAGGERWKTWNKKLRAVVGAQEKVGAEKGSWSPVGEESRVVATVYAQMVLQEYYRYSRVFWK